MQGVTEQWDEISIDTGCEYSPSCLTCPLPVCKYEAPLATQLRMYRDALIVREIKDNPTERRRDIASRLDISYSTVTQAWHLQHSDDPAIVESIFASEWIQRLVNGAG